jgi:hypothetical protein
MRNDSERCPVCKGWPEEHNEWQKEHCRRLSICGCHLHQNRVCDICQGYTGKETDLMNFEGTVQ